MNIFAFKSKIFLINGSLVEIFAPDNINRVLFLAFFVSLGRSLNALSQFSHFHPSLYLSSLFK